MCQYLCAYTGAALSEFFVLVGSLPSFLLLDDLSTSFTSLRKVCWRCVSLHHNQYVISITDGQIFLSMDLFLAGVKPAIDVGLSVTRVGSAAQWAGMKVVAGSYKLELAQYAELQSSFASDLGEETNLRLEQGRRIEMLKQFSGSPIHLSSQISLLSLANQNLIASLATHKIQVFLHLFLAVPIWASFFVPARLLGLVLLSVVGSRMVVLA